MPARDVPGRIDLEIRPGRAEDADDVADLYDRLSAQDRYRRFFSGGPPPRSWIDRWLDVAGHGGVVLVAVAHDGGAPRIVGEAGYGVVADGSAELGIAVAPECRGWLGPRLLDALVTTARDAGVTVLEAEVLTENRPMLRLLASRGDAVIPLDDFRTVRIAIPTAGRVPVWPPRFERPRLLVEVPGGRWRGSAAAEAAGVRVLACPERLDRCPALRGEPCPLVTDADLVVLVARHDGSDDALRAAHHAVHPGRCVVVDDGHADVAAIVAAAQAGVSAATGAAAT